VAVKVEEKYDFLLNYAKAFLRNSAFTERGRHRINCKRFTTWHIFTEAAIASQISIEAVAVVIWKPDSRSDSFDEKSLASIWPLSISSFSNEMYA
jgi:hypothetical protein